MRILFIILFISLMFMKTTAQKTDFVTVSDSGTFLLNDSSYQYLGMNFWYGMNLGAYEKERLTRELDHLKEIGLTNLRIMASSEGPDSEPYRITPSLQVKPGEYNKELWKGLDFLLVEMKKREMKAVICLSNFWPWSGGLGQYIVWAKEAESIPYPPPEPKGNWDTYQRFVSRFYKSKKAMKLLEDHIIKVISRKNSISEIEYRDDPTIMSWELCNEPRGMHRSRSFGKWIKKTSHLIKSIDFNHLVTIGAEGDTPYPKYAGLSFRKNHSYSSIDYTTMHVWIENFNWYDPKKNEKTYEKSVNKALNYINKHAILAKKLNKPIVLEEFGIARNNRSYDPSSSITNRDRFFQTIFDRCIQLRIEETPIAGINCWAWGGEARPLQPYGGIWKSGDPIIGDPPHEHQGWYSIYNSDLSTLKLLKSSLCN